jgi:hypothetical protein
MWWIIYGWLGIALMMVVCWMNQGTILRGGNRLIDYYLDWKYTGYQHQQVTNMYCLSKIIVDRGPSGPSGDVIGGVGRHQRQEFPYGTDLKQEAVTIKCGQFGKYSVLYIYFSYGENMYTLPVSYDPDLVIKLPIYDYDDIETSMKEEYTTAETKDHHDEILPIIQRYAGPKGDFYAGTPYVFKPSLIYDDLTGKLLLHGEDDYLRMTTAMGETIELKP